MTGGKHRSSARGSLERARGSDAGSGTAWSAGNRPSCPTVGE
jgi:hypothetical protein